MSGNKKGLEEYQISEFLVDLDVSDCEDFDEDDDDHPEDPQDHQILEEGISQDLESEWEESDDEPLSDIVSRDHQRQALNRPLTWNRAENFNYVFDAHPPLETQPLENSPSLLNSYEYFSKYIHPSFFDIVSTCTNTSSVERTGKSLNTTPEEICSFIGCTMAIGILGLPRIRMFWAAETRVKLVAETFSRDRYFNIRANLKVVEDHKVSPAMKVVDRFWKIRPVVSEIERACRENERQKCVSIDEQMIPFTGKCKMKQVVKGKPNPEGIKVFLMTNPNGLPLDLYLYQGQGTSVESALHPMPEKLDLAGRVILKLVDTLPLKTSIYIGRYFTSITLLENLTERNINCTGTLMKNRVPGYVHPKQQQKKKKALIKTDRTLQKNGRGSYDCVVRQDEKIAVVKRIDSNPIHVASTEIAVQPLGTCRRWNKKDRQYLDIPQSAAIKNYNTYMGGIDLLDRIIGKYPMRGRTGKWTVRAIFHFFDFAAAAAWIEYRQDAVRCGLPLKEIKQYLEFKMDLAKYLVNGGTVQFQSQCSSPSLERLSRNSPSMSPRQISSFRPALPMEEEQVPPNPKRSHRLVEPMPHTSQRVKEAKHLPVCAKGNQSNRSKCRKKGCSQLTFVKCSTCNIFLCFNVKRNCFSDFHLQ